METSALQNISLKNPPLKKCLTTNGNEKPALLALSGLLPQLKTTLTKKSSSQTATLKKHLTPLLWKLVPQAKKKKNLPKYLLQLTRRRSSPNSLTARSFCWNILDTC